MRMQAKDTAAVVWSALGQDGAPYFKKIRGRGALDVLEVRAACACVLHAECMCACMRMCVRASTCMRCTESDPPYWVLVGLCQPMTVPPVSSTSSSSSISRCALPPVRIWVCSAVQGRCTRRYGMHVHANT